VTSKFAKNRLRVLLMKLGTMLEVDESFTTIGLSRSSKVRSRWGYDLSPLLGLFFHSHDVTRSSHHAVISSQASFVQTYEWTMLNYAGKAGNGYTASFVAEAIFQVTP